MSQAPSSSSSGSTPSASTAKFTEYKLKMSPMAVLHNVMVLNSTPAKLSDFTPPIRMIRDKKSSLLGEEASSANSSTANATTTALAVGKASNASKRKSRLIFQGDQPGGLFDDPSDSTETESIPWLLEDFDGQHSFLGRLEGGQGSNYVFFVNQGDEFRIIPVSKWYRFAPKLSYHTFTLEEAEQEMAARSKGDVDRWLMKQRNKTTTAASASTSGSTSVSPTTSPHATGKKARLINRLGAEVETQQKRLLQAQQSKNFRDSHEDLDFDEVFDDDDEGNNDLIPDADEEGNGLGKSSKSPLKKATYKLSTEGRQMKRIVKHLDKDNDIIYASDDEMDPYASEDEEDVEDYLEQYKSSSNKANDEGNFDKLVDSVMTAKSRSTTPATSRATSPSVSPQKSVVASSTSTSTTTAKKVKQDPLPSSQSDDIITEAQLVSFLRQGPLSTKDLIAKFKRQLKADPKNKDIFRELVRKVAMVKGSGAGEEDKLLELKPEYR